MRKAKPNPVGNLCHFWMISFYCLMANKQYRGFTNHKMNGLNVMSVCRNCLGTGVEIGVYGKHKCAFCDETQIDGCLATRGDKVKPAMASEDGSCDSEALEVCGDK